MIVAIICFFVMRSAQGLIGPNGGALASAAVPDHPGTGSAVLGFVQWVAAATIAPIAGLGGEHTAIPVATHDRRRRRVHDRTRPRQTGGQPRRPANTGTVNASLSERKASTKPCHPAHLMHSCASQSVFNTLAMSSGVVLCGQCCGVK
jgi:hypothetical protein